MADRNNSSSFDVKHGHICETSYTGKNELSEQQIYGLVAFDITVLLINLVLNTLVIVYMLGSKNLNKVGFKLIFCLSVSDICLALIAQTLFAIMLIKYPDTTNCDIELSVQFFAILFTHTSGYIIALIGFDRYARIRYLTRYAEKFTHKRVNIALIIVCVLSILQASLYVVGTEYNFFKGGKRIAVIIDVLIALSVFFFYLLAIREIKRHNRNTAAKSVGLQSINQSMVKVASKILLSILLFYISYVIISFSHSILIDKVNSKTKQILDFLLICSYIFTYCNSFVNAAIFLGVNKTAQRHLKNVFKPSEEAGSSSERETITIADETPL